MSKFKVGDRVRVKNARDDAVPEGIVGTVMENDHTPNIKWDGWASLRSDGLWCVPEDNLELASAARFSVVHVDDFDCEFDTQEEAEEEARRLAGQGEKVAVYKLVATAAPASVSFERFA